MRISLLILNNLTFLIYENYSFYHHVKKNIISFLYLLAGINLGILPFLAIDLGFFYKGGDVDFIGGMLLAALFSVILAGCLMFLDLLIIRFLFKKEFSNYMYLVAGFLFGALYYWAVTLV